MLYNIQQIHAYPPINLLRFGPTAVGNGKLRCTLHFRFKHYACHICFCTAAIALLTEDNLDGDKPSVTVEVNENCSNAYPYQVSVSFGVRKEGSTEGCVVKDVVNKTLTPGNSDLFKVNVTKVPLVDGQEYCFNVSLQETTIRESYTAKQLLQWVGKMVGIYTMGNNPSRQNYTVIQRVRQIYRVRSPKALVL